jgi:hypothetical protein
MTQHSEGTAADQRTERNPVATLELIKRNAQVASLEMGVLEHGTSSDSAVARSRDRGVLQGSIAFCPVGRSACDNRPVGRYFRTFHPETSDAGQRG